MTIHTLTEKAIAVTGLPEGAKAWMNESYHLNTVWYKSDEMRHTKYLDLPEGNWTILGRAAELNESQKAEYEPLLEAKGLHVTNPKGDQPEFVFNQYGKSPSEFKRFENDSKQWQSDDELSNPLILTQ